MLVIGKIGNTAFQNNNMGKVLSRYGLVKCIRTVQGGDKIKVLRKWKSK